MLTPWPCYLSQSISSAYLDALTHVLVLFWFQRELDEKLLKLLVAVVDAELLKAENESLHVYVSRALSLVKKYEFHVQDII